MRERGSVRRTIAYLAIVGVVAACGFGEALQDYGDPVNLSPDSLAGSWRSGPDPRLITFSEDGTFTAVDLPYEIFHEELPRSFDPLHDKVDGAGTWKFLPSREGLNSAVELTFREIFGKEVRYGGLELQATQYEGHPVWLVFYYVGDGGNDTTSYERCGADCPSLAGALSRAS
jgi:hypothetical protein